MSLKSILKYILSITGTYDWFRRFYYSKRKTTYKILGLKSSFWTATPAMYKRIIASGGEKDQMEKFIKSIKRGDVVWDVGSFVGMYSILASQAVGAGGRVYAFEPEPNSWELLNKNCELNKITNMITMKMALSDSNGKATIYSSKTDDVAIHSLRKSHGLDERGTTTDTYTGDYLVDNMKVMLPNVVKVDVEGADFQVLRGMQKILSHPNCRFLLIEVHPKILPDFGKSLDDVRHIILSFGFSISEEILRGDEVHFVCTRKEACCSTNFKMQGV